MKKAVFLTLLALFLPGCSEYGHHPHYIISHEELPKSPQEEVH